MEYYDVVTANRHAARSFYGAKTVRCPSAPKAGKDRNKSRGQRRTQSTAWPSRHTRSGPAGVTVFPHCRVDRGACTDADPSIPGLAACRGTRFLRGPSGLVGRFRCCIARRGGGGSSSTPTACARTDRSAGSPVYSHAPWRDGAWRASPAGLDGAASDVSSPSATTVFADTARGPCHETGLDVYIDPAVRCDPATCMYSVSALKSSGAWDDGVEPTWSITGSQAERNGVCARE
jgi:hypothetical protein